MNAPCPTKYTTGPDCPCETSPFQNISAELPDVADFICLSSVPTEAHLGDTWQRNACTKVGHSTISQEDACNVARANALACVYDGDLDSNGIQRPLVGNKKIDTVVNGIHVIIPPNTYYGGNQPTADTIALSFAQGIGFKAQFAVSPVTFLERLNQGAADTMSVIGGTGPFTWLLASGSLPPGIALFTSTATTATLSGTPITTGTFLFTLQVFDTKGNYLILPVTYKVIGILTATPLPFAPVGVAYSVQMIQGGLAVPLFWTVAGGSLPAGLLLNFNTGLLSGIPTVAGQYSFTIQVADFANVAATKAFTLLAAQINNATPLPNINRDKVGDTVNFTQSGMTAPITWSVTAGSLPNGMTLAAATGVLSGTPTVAAVFSFTMKAADTFGNSVSKAFTITILAPFTWNLGNYVFTQNVGVPASTEVHAADGTNFNMYLGQQATWPVQVTNFAWVDLTGDNFFVGPYTGPAAHARLAFSTQNWNRNQIGLVEVTVGGVVVLSIDSSYYTSNHAAINFDFVIPASVNAIVAIHQRITLQEVFHNPTPPAPVNGDILSGSIQGNCTVSSPI